MKKFLILFLAFFIFSCSPDSATEKVESVNIYSMVDPSAKFDLQALGALIRSGKIKNAEDLEFEINKKGGVNNLDFNNDGNIDYVNVKENNGTNNVKSFDLFTKNNNGLNHLATIEAEMADNQYNVRVAGNRQIYGQNAYYEDRFDVGDAALGFALGAWMFSDREPYYHQPYYGNRYPSNYTPYRTVSTTVYRSRTKPLTSNSSFVKTKKAPLKIKSTYSGKTTKNVRTKFSNSRKNMKQLKQRKQNKEIKKGGFTKSSKGKKNAKKSSKKRYTPKKKIQTKPYRAKRSGSSRRRH